MSKEIWKYINGFDNYKISNKGRVKSYNYCYGNNEDGVIYLKINPHHKGYVDVKLFKKNKLYNKKIHRLVATEFISNPFFCLIRKYVSALCNKSAISSSIKL